MIDEPADVAPAAPIEVETLIQTEHVGTAVTAAPDPLETGKFASRTLGLRDAFAAVLDDHVTCRNRDARKDSAPVDA